jgi:hypothetical protein
MKIEHRITPENIQSLEKYQIFVFGSNLAGIHGAGAAKLARDNMWAKYGKGYGIHWAQDLDMVGSYAIPTKGLYMEALDIPWIRYYIYHFIEEASKFPQLTYLVTEIGCGLASYTPEEIAPLFKEAINVENIHLPQRFWDVINKKIIC